MKIISYWIRTILLCKSSLGDISRHKGRRGEEKVEVEGVRKEFCNRKEFLITKLKASQRVTVKEV